MSVQTQPRQPLKEGPMSMLRLLRVAAVLAMVVAIGATAHAQAITGSISGTVVDEQGQSIPGATVTAIDERTGSARSDTTDTRGNFLFTAMPPDTYTVRVEMSNFRTVD